MMTRRLFALVALVFVAGCNSDTASYMVNGDRDNAFSMFREKSWPGADWTLTIVLTQQPECQRRYPLKPISSGDAFKAELFVNAERTYLLHAGSSWYEMRLNGCKLQELASAPAAPGDQVGAWEQREDNFKFFPINK